MKDLLQFLAILLVFVVACGVCYHSLMYPNHESLFEGRWEYWRIWRMLYIPYWQIYGEPFNEEIEGNNHSTIGPITDISKTSFEYFHKAAFELVCGIWSTHTYNSVFIHSHNTNATICDIQVCLTISGKIMPDNCAENYTVWLQDPSIERCPYEDWMAPMLSTLYVLICNLLLVNLVIALFR